MSGRALQERRQERGRHGRPCLIPSFTLTPSHWQKTGCLAQVPRRSASRVGKERWLIPDADGRLLEKLPAAHFEAALGDGGKGGFVFRVDLPAEPWHLAWALGTVLSAATLAEEGRSPWRPACRPREGGGGLSPPPAGG